MLLEGVFGSDMLSFQPNANTCADKKSDSKIVNCNAALIFSALRSCSQRTSWSSFLCVQILHIHFDNLCKKVFLPISKLHCAVHLAAASYPVKPQQKSEESDFDLKLCETGFAHSAVYQNWMMYWTGRAEPRNRGRVDGIFLFCFQSFPRALPYKCFMKQTGP